MFYVYAPIFAVTSGLGAEAGGIVVSIGTGRIWLVPFWGWVGRRLACGVCCRRAMRLRAF